jgi:hypothetical protein
VVSPLIGSDKSPTDEGVDSVLQSIRHFAALRNFCQAIIEVNAKPFDWSW